MTSNSRSLAHLGRHTRSHWRAALAGLAICTFALNAVAQTPAAAPAAATAQDAAPLDLLVGPIALYPDDLIAIILPASTSPLQIVQADRYLDKRKTDPKLPLDDNWDDAVKSLLNYPDVVKKMSADLDWTSALGEAVVTDQAAVLEGVQSFRRRAQAAGNLKSDSKQVVTAQKETIIIQPADPQVIYVPQYNPTTVVTYGVAPIYGYYPTPYPSYYYPYAPGAAMAAGVIWGAAIGAAWSGNHYGWGGGNTINVNRNTNVNVNNTNINRGGGGQAGGGTAWKSNKQPGQVSNSVGKTASSARAGDARPGAGGGVSAGGARASAQPSGAGAGGANRASASGGGAFANSGASGRQTQMDSSRGAASRSSASSMGARSSHSSGGARAGGGGGGARAGGGGGGRGGRR